MGKEGQNPTLKKEGYMISRDVIYKCIEAVLTTKKGIKKICSFAREHCTCTLR